MRKPTSNQNKVRQIPKSELVELIQEPLSHLIEKARLDILRELSDIAESLQIIARQTARQITEDGDMHQ